jgi:hypothetical protein
MRKTPDHAVDLAIRRVDAMNGLSNRILRRAAIVAALGLGLVASGVAAESVEERADHMQRRIAEDIAHRRISPKDASKIEHDMEKVSKHVVEARREQRGGIGRRDWEKIEHELDKVESKVRDAEAWNVHCRECRTEGFHDNRW